MTREEAIEQFKYSIELIKQDGKDYLDERDIPMLKMAIESLENQKTGHWIETTLANGRKGMKCSNCGREPIEDALYGYIYSDYCPNCGAKMERE